MDTGGFRGDYAYSRPSAVTSIVYPNRTDSYAYNNAGQLTSRTVSGKTTTMAWDEAGRLSRSTANGQNTDYVYSADGERLIRREPGASTLYLGEMELRSASGTVTAKRYYAAGDGVVVAVRNSSPHTLTWLVADPQSSEQIAIDNATSTVYRQRYAPFGAHRGGRDDITATDRGFLGKTEDGGSGLVLLSARYYDPSIGRFISPDPATDLRNPQWTNNYAYAANNPVSRMDPTGLASCTNANKNRCRPDEDALKGKPTAEQMAKYQYQCWYQGKNCNKLPKEEQVPPWKRTTTGKTVRDALYAVADLLAKEAIKSGIAGGCTMPIANKLCQELAKQVSKIFSRAVVDSFCQQHKALCAAPAPDYISLGFSLGKWGLYVGISVTVTRTGQVYIGTEAGVGWGPYPIGVAIKVGWVFGPDGRRADDAAVSTFPQGAVTSVTGTVPGLYLGFAATDTHHAVELGNGIPGVSFGRGYGYLQSNYGPLWTI